MTNKAAASDGDRDEPTGPETRAVDAASVKVEFTINTLDDRGGRISKPAAVVLPADLNEPEAFAYVEAVMSICRKVIADAEAKNKPGLLIMRAPLPR